MRERVIFWLYVAALLVVICSSVVLVLGKSYPKQRPQEHHEYAPPKSNDLHPEWCYWCSDPIIRI